jgi:hypothetical protein
MANKTARIAWAALMRSEVHRAPDYGRIKLAAASAAAPNWRGAQGMMMTI